MECIQCIIQEKRHVRTVLVPEATHYRSASALPSDVNTRNMRLNALIRGNCRQDSMIGENRRPYQSIETRLFTTLIPCTFKGWPKTRNVYKEIQWTKLEEIIIEITSGELMKCWNPKFICPKLDEGLKKNAGCNNFEL
ncbi:MAG: hypothetical protein EZS28_028396 [Streblomastix strix]|uniref:Uncharacterized protein n=1 Tax=Streblomastix strix TaxID=222440 RepID=A0A5J4V211_9EUKA|nr:MAG: hypothetical protein EZS28_028396 [Streblomastix strix]